MATMRVDELAEAAGVSVDTVRFYQKQHLLPPPVRMGRVALYDDAHLARLERVRDLQRRGFTLGVIRRFLSGELDAADEPLAAAVRNAAAPDGMLSASELAERSGVPLALIDAVAREGLLVPRRSPSGPSRHPGTTAGVDDAEVLYTGDDVRIVAAGLALLRAGLPISGLLDLARRHHESTRDIAAAAVGLFDEAVRRPLRESDLPEEEKAERLVEAFATLLPAVSDLVAHHFRRVLLEVAQEHLEAVGHPAELAAASLAVVP